MSQKKINFTTFIVIIAVVAIGAGVIAGFGGVEGIKDMFGDNGSSPLITETKKNNKKRTRAIAGKPYAQLITEGNQLMAQLDFDGALEMFQQAAELSPKDPIPYEKVGDVFVVQGQYEKAADSYSFAFKLNSNNRALFLKKIRSLMNGRKITEAQTELAKVQTKTPEILYLMSLVESFFNEQQKARSHLEEILKLTPEQENSTDLTSLTVIKANAQKLNSMYVNFDLANEAPLAYLQALLSKTYNELGEYGLSIETGFNAIKIQNDYRDVWIIMGHSFLKTQRWHDAEDALTKAISLDQKHPAAFFYRGLSRIHTQKINDALGDFSAALDLGYKPQVQVQYQMAQAYYILGGSQKALQLYTEVLSVDPSLLSYFKRPIELSLFVVKDFKQAEYLINRAITHHPQNAAPYAWKSFVALSAGNLLDARNLLNKALSLDKQERFTRLVQAELERAVGNQSAAEASYKKLQEELNGPDDVLMQEYIKSVTSSFTLPSLTLE